jgi:hypothetical protein
MMRIGCNQPTNKDVALNKKNTMRLIFRPIISYDEPGKKIELVVDPADKVSSLKDKVRQICNGKKKMKELFVAGISLSDHTSIGFYNLQEGSTTLIELIYNCHRNYY